MRRDELLPFTDIEKELAESCHYIVYQFLKSKGYPIEDYYNIVVMGYLKGIQKYYRSEDIDIEDLVGTCWNCMRSEVGNHLQKEKAKKRQPVEIPVGNVASAEDEVLAAELLRDAIEDFNDQQKEIILLKILGYSNTEIYQMMEISKSSYYRELERIRRKITEED